MGLAGVDVFRRIRVGILSTGDEVTPAGQPLLPGHVYDSNRVSLMGALQTLGAEILDLGLARDCREQIAAALRRGADTADAIITTGGVSEGDFDLVKDVIEELGVINFWKVRMKPGKPQAHGRLGRALFFGLPGNPVSTLAVFLLMVRPALLKLMGSQPDPPRRLKLPLRGRIAKSHDRMDFQRAIVHFEADQSWVESTGNQSSGALSSLSRGNAFVVLPVEPVRFEDGDAVEVWLID
jgi:molybdopterin molybdotransferase